MAQPVTLIFPSSMGAALAYSRQALDRGETIVAASSVIADETAQHYRDWHFLPSIYEADFVARLCALVTTRGITRFYTPHATIYHFIRELVANGAIELEIEPHSPTATIDHYYRELLTRADAAQSFITAIAGRPAPRPLLGALFHYGEQIYGQTNETKMAAMAGIFAASPRGDIIEIGSAWGRSAFLLAMLAQHYGTGALLAIDPWNLEIAQQHESPDRLLEVNRALDWDLMAVIFAIHLQPFTHGRANCLRLTSHAAAAQYGKDFRVRSEAFGETFYTGRAAVIHLDGNHDYDAIAEDVRLWRSALVPGGWLIIDDYVWEHGTGPRLIGDALLNAESSAITHCFTAGKALFLQFGRNPGP